jgi:demethylmenaquinone methyltransferase / 2-methoxy-6-polyprenyl-1,4-benzoquinol methylase
MGFIANRVLREGASAERHAVPMTTKSPVATGRSEATPTSPPQRPTDRALSGRVAALAPPDSAATPVPAAATSDNGHGPIPEAPASRTGNELSEQDVTAMFDDIAPVYDRLNTLMTLGADARWRRVAVAAASLSSGAAVIDVACGTGKLAAALAEQVGPFGRVLAIDLSPGMIAHGAQCHYDLVQLEFRLGNALHLPTGDAEFDAATIAFGLRNLADYSAGFRELRRVVKPGGRVVCLELTTPRPRWWGRTFRFTFGRVTPLIGRLFGREGAYRYLPASLEGFPEPDGLASTMREAGLEHVGYRRMGLGSVALHVGVVPTSATAPTTDQPIRT